MTAPKTDIAIKMYSGDKVVYVFKDGRRMSLDELKEYMKDHYVVIL